MLNFEKKLTLHFGVPEVTSCSYSTLAVMLSSSLHCRECLSSLHTSTLYKTQRCKAIGLTCLRTTYVPLTLKITTYVETALGLTLTRSCRYMYKIYQASSNTR